MLFGSTSFDLFIEFRGKTMLFENRWTSGMETFKLDDKILSKRFSLIGDVHTFELEDCEIEMVMSLAPVDFSNKVSIYADDELVGLCKIPFWRRRMTYLVDEGGPVEEFQNPLRKWGFYPLSGGIIYVLMFEHIFFKLLVSILAFNLCREGYLSMTEREEVDPDDSE